MSGKLNKVVHLLDNGMLRLIHSHEEVSCSEPLSSKITKLSCRDCPLSDQDSYSCRKSTREKVYADIYNTHQHPEWFV